MNKKERNELYEIARKAVDDKDDQKAIEIYQRIRDQYPVEWEAFFFTIYLNVYVCPDDELLDAGTAVYKSEKDVFNLIDTYVRDYDKHINAINVVGRYLEYVALDLSDIAFDMFEKSNKGDSEINDLINLNIVADNILATYINLVTKRYSGDFKTDIWLKAQFYLESIMEIKARIIPFLKGEERARFEADLNDLIRVGREHNLKCPADISYSENDSYSGKKGCYIATAVYGSYDCPEVWALRRYRDYYLAHFYLGRVFISVYYLLSPLAVKWFGNRVWFRKSWKKILDRKIQRLKDEGYETSPYDDLNW